MLATSPVERLNAYLDSMTFRERLNFLLRAGVAAEKLLGVESCDSHPRVLWRPMHDAEPLDFTGASVWCKGCFKWWIS